jgi:hypothetical protein
VVVLEVTIEVVVAAGKDNACVGVGGGAWDSNR